MPIAALVAAGQLFDVAEGSLRVAVTRLVAAGRVERDERGRYRLGGAAAPVSHQLDRWRRIDERTCNWNGSWIGVQFGTGGRDAARRRGERALRWFGFEELTPGLRVRPENLRGGVAGQREALRSLGLESETLVLRLEELDAEADQRARGLWDAQALESGYRQAIRELAESEARLEESSEAQAMVESFLLGGRIIRQLALDPLLPKSLVDPEPRSALVRAMLHYDRRGRRSWAAFMERHGAPHTRNPIHGGGGEPLPALS